MTWWWKVKESSAGKAVRKTLKRGEPARIYICSVCNGNIVMRKARKGYVGRCEHNACQKVFAVNADMVWCKHAVKRQWRDDKRHWEGARCNACGYMRIYYDFVEPPPKVVRDRHGQVVGYRRPKA